MNRTQSTATTPGQSGPGGNGNEGVRHIPQISKAGASLSDCLMSYPGHSLVGVLSTGQRNEKEKELLKDGKFEFKVFLLLDQLPYQS